MKYVVLKDRKSGFLSPVFCVAPITHKQLADAFKLTHEAVSAGFCEPLGAPDGRYHISGYSATLNLRPAPGDAPLIEAMTRATLRMVPEPQPAV